MSKQVDRQPPKRKSDNISSGEQKITGKEAAAQPTKRTNDNVRSKEREAFDRYARMASCDAPTPRTELRNLYRAALRSNNVGRAARYFLFWLDGENAPDVPIDEGARALFDINQNQKVAMFEVLRWWIEPGKKIEPLLRIHEKLRAQFKGKAASAQAKA